MIAIWLATQLPCCALGEFESRKKRIVPERVKLILRRQMMNLEKTLLDHYVEDSFFTEWEF